jgi:hypothetical protein
MCRKNHQNKANIWAYFITKNKSKINKSSDEFLENELKLLIQVIKLFFSLNYIKIKFKINLRL